MDKNFVEPERYGEYQRLTIKSYNENAQRWTAAHEAVGLWQEQLEYFRKKFLHTGLIIDVGCGSGRDIKTMTELGFKCVGIDASKGLLEIAKKQVPSAEFIDMNIFEMPNLARKFDGFISIATLLHIPKPKITDALLVISSALKDNAFGLIIIKKGRGEEFEVRDIEGRHEERLFSYWLRPEFEKILNDAGFRLMHYFEKDVGRSTWSGYYVQLVAKLDVK